MQGMDAAMDYEALDAFYRVEEGGEMVSRRRNDQRLLLFPRGGATGGCSGVTTYGLT
jgi:hypothetical protein